MTSAISSKALSKVFALRGRCTSFKALDEVTFEIEAGEAVGIIGRNGAGKSTLLKILARILPPTSGRVVLSGRVGSLLEVGTGFHPELSGRENIYLSAAVLGMQEKEVDKRFDAIVEFSGVEAFLEEPVRHYSSGMYTRLAFAVAAHLEPEILLVDEVLAVGDMDFQKKCLQRLDTLGQNGQTVLFVSHNIQAVARFCRRGLWIDAGRLVQDGPIEEVSAAYLKQGGAHPGARQWPEGPHAPGDEVVRLRKVLVRGRDGGSTARVDIGQPFEIEIDYEVAVGGLRLFPALKLFNEWGTEIIWSTDVGTPHHGQERPPGRYHCSITIPANLLTEGLMAISVNIVSLNPKKVHVNEYDCVHFQATEVIDGTTSRGSFHQYIGSVVRPRLDWQVTAEGKL